jgi:alanine dehydrogenase
MKVAIPRESFPGENRVALIPVLPRLLAEDGTIVFEGSARNGY